jgi:hypothetical protein
MNKNIAGGHSMPPHCSITISPPFALTSEPSPLLPIVARLMRSLERSLHHAVPRPQIWVISSPQSPYTNSLVEQLDSELKRMDPSDFQQLFASSGTVSPLTDQNKFWVEHAETFRRFFIRTLPILGMLGYGSNILATLLTNQCTDQDPGCNPGDSLFQRAVIGWSRQSPVESTSLFAGFSGYYAALWSILGTGLAYGLSKLNFSRILSEKIPNFITVTTPITPHDLIGTPKNPGLLFQSMNGILMISSPNLLKEGADDLLFTIASNNGEFSFVLTPGHPPTRITYTGQLIIIGSQNELPPVAILSGRVRDISTLPPIHTALPQVLDPLETSQYTSLQLPSAETLKQNPFFWVIGRNELIEKLKNTCEPWINAIKSTPKTTPSMGFLLCDGSPNTYGIGKTVVAQALLDYIAQAASSSDPHCASPLIPGYCVVKQGTGAAILPYSGTAPQSSSFDKSISLFMILAGAYFIAVVSVLLAILSQADSHADHSPISRLFNIESALGGAALAGGALMVGHQHFNTPFSDRPLVLTQPRRHLSCLQLSSPPPLSAWTGSMNPSSSAKHRQFDLPADHAWIPGVDLVLAESINTTAADSSQMGEQKQEWQRITAAVITHSSVQLGGTGPKMPVHTFFAITSNSTPDALDPDLVAACKDKTFVLPAVIDFDPKTDGPTLKRLLKKNNSAGFPWSDLALDAFVKNVQFHSFLFEGKALLLRPYFTEMIPLATEQAEKRGQTIVSISAFREAWLEMQTHYLATFKRILGVTFTPQFSPPPYAIRPSTAWN